MPRLHILSDLHIEFVPYTYVAPPGNVDIVVLAGDIAAYASRHRLEILLDQILRDGREIVMVAGNHEFYGHEIPRGLQELKALETKFPGFHFLDCEMVTVKGVIFAGATLWSDFTLYGSPKEHGRLAERGIADFRDIKDDGALTAEKMAARHRVAKSFLAQIASTVDVVVTHFVPSPESVHPKYLGDPLNPYFASDLRAIIRTGPKLWIHGHTHSCFDYRHGGCRVVANPRGYDRENPHFDSKLVIPV